MHSGCIEWNWAYMEKWSCWGVLFTENLVAMVKAAFWIQRETVSNRNPRKVNFKVDQKNPKQTLKGSESWGVFFLNFGGYLFGVFCFVWLLGFSNIRIFACNLSFKFLFSCYLCDRFFHSLSIQAQLARNHFITSICSHLKNGKLISGRCWQKEGMLWLEFLLLIWQVTNHSTVFIALCGTDKIPPIR